jgi:purine-binding chemotaxis protein CheW
MGNFLRFSVEGVLGAIPLKDIIYLIRMSKLVPSLEESEDIVGFLNLHGTLIPVYSMRRLFGFSDRSPKLTDNLIIIKLDKSTIALWVDETYVVSDITISPEDINLNSSVKFVPGTTEMDNGLILIYDISRFLNEHKKNSADRLSDIVKFKNDINLPDINTNEDISEVKESEHIDIILKERAEELAQPEEVINDASIIEVLKFQLIYQDYAVEMKFVRESILSRDITPVPGTPDYILGVISVRGEIIALIDLRVLLLIPEKGLTDFNQVIILTNGIITFGILVDQITEISTIPKDKIFPPDSRVSPVKPNYISGISPDSLIIVNAEEILSDPDIVVDQSKE